MQWFFYRELTARHVQAFGSAVDDLIDGLHRKIPRHKLDHRSQSCQTGTNSQSKQKSLFYNITMFFSFKTNPVNPASVIGASNTLFSPCFSNNPFETFRGQFGLKTKKNKKIVSNATKQKPCKRLDIDQLLHPLEILNHHAPSLF
jgi:hypothetical protein